MGSDKFCLRWNDFESNISSAFKELRDDKDFFDVTLACGDEEIRAHKVILSACSTFFRNVLRRNPHHHPFMYLKGVRFVDLQAVLNFMYHGEVNVAQEELNSFLAVAEDLRVKGLTQNQSGASGSSQDDTAVDASTQKVNKPKSTSNSHIPPALERSGPDRTQTKPKPPDLDTDDEVLEVVPVKSEPRDVSISQLTPNLYTNITQQSSHALATADEHYQESFDEYDQYAADGDVQNYTGRMENISNFEGNKVWSQSQNYDGLEEQIECLIQSQADGGFLCTACGYCNNLKYNMKKHVETHIETPAYPCNYCSKEFKTKNSLNTHTSVHHRDERRKKKMTGIHI